MIQWFQIIVNCKAKKELSCTDFNVDLIVGSAFYFKASYYKPV